MCFLPRTIVREERIFAAFLWSYGEHYRKNTENVFLKGTKLSKAWSLCTELARKKDNFRSKQEIL